ncbi:unnamed protein product [Leptosia nina]|uniref:Glycolipid transfer protein domain-containing protein n=1 Tax=Leptosia nina TaxID=320188 RepID=A0AAV1JSB0_9NEOP
MANSESGSKIFSFHDLNYFPTVERGKINISQFLKASLDLLCIVDSLGSIMKPVKNDMQGNIDKIQNKFVYDETSCLLELLHKEISKEEYNGAEATLWLNRALLFFELTFQEILKALKDKQEINMKAIFTIAYEGSVKKYHNWAVQKLFMVICRLSPTFPQILTSLGLENVEQFETKMTHFNESLHTVRCSIDTFYVENSLFLDS